MPISLDSSLYPAPLISKDAHFPLQNMGAPQEPIYE